MTKKNICNRPYVINSVENLIIDQLSLFLYKKRVKNQKKAGENFINFIKIMV